MKRILVLLSGNGSNFQAILDACEKKEIPAKIVAVFSDVADAYGLTRARLANIPNWFYSPRDFISRQEFEKKLIKDITPYQPDLIILAGFMRILSPNFVHYYQGRILNIHPSLLPQYPGLNTHRQVLKNGDKEHGASVHVVTEELDAGPIILQAKVPVFPDDDETSLRLRVQKEEHRIYPQAIRKFLSFYDARNKKKKIFLTEP